MSKKTDVTEERPRMVFEPVDSTPMAVPVGLRKPESMDERIRRIVSHSHQKALSDAGYETFEEADDFDIADDPVDALTPWEQDFDLSAVQAVDAGVVSRPQVQDPRTEKAKSVLGIFRDFVREKTGDDRAREFAQYYHKRTAPPEPPKAPPKQEE